ncbi:MAG TPA: sugar transferase [Gemmatimonadales bacterium]|nr:sugar transferase [Gemmatimonadales bacterium]
MSKVLLDRVAAGLGLLLLSPLLVPVAVVIWLQDRHSPFYVANRIGRRGRPFRMVKFRSMIVRADRTGVDSTAGDDPRITAVGRFIRRFKLDELPQLWNVLKGEMSLVGPRPNVERETALYTAEEQELLSVPPGITDLASIVFSDEGDILRGSADPDLRYNQLIRPWKSRLGLLYLRRRPTLALDLRIILLTLTAAADRPAALRKAAALVRELGGEPELVQVAERRAPLISAPPPGATEVVQSRQVSVPPRV